MKRSWLSLAACLLIAMTLTGCWNRRELNTLAIQMGTAIDKVDGLYKLTAQIVEPSEVAQSKSKSGRAPVVTYQATGKSIFEAFRKMTDVSPRKIYGAHIRVLIIGEALAREGVRNVLDLLARDPEIRTDFFVLVARDGLAEDVLKVLTPIEKIPANKLNFSLKTAEKAWAPAATFTLDEFIDQLVAEGMNPVLTGVRVRGSVQKGNNKQNVEQIDPPANLEVSGLAVFKEDKLVGWLNTQQSIGYNFITDRVTSTVIPVACPSGNGTVTFETISAHAKMRARIENGEPVVSVHVKSVSNVGEVQCKIDLTDPKTMIALQKNGEAKRIAQMKDAVETMQNKYKVDIFGFGQAINRAAPRYWESVKDSWKELFPRLKVEYKVDISLRKVGSTTNSYLGDIKE